MDIQTQHVDTIYWIEDSQWYEKHGQILNAKYYNTDIELFQKDTDCNDPFMYVSQL